MGYGVPRCSRLCHHFLLPSSGGKAFFYIEMKKLEVSIQEVQVAQMPTEKLCKFQ